MWICFLLLPAHCCGSGHVVVYAGLIFVFAFALLLPICVFLTFVWPCGGPCGFDFLCLPMLCCGPSGFDLPFCLAMWWSMWV